MTLTSYTTIMTTSTQQTDGKKKMSELTVRSGFSKIDDKLNQFGFSCFRDADHLNVYKDIGSAWLFDQKFSSKSKLVEFANSL